jgi:proteic killer suppression protein
VILSFADVGTQDVFSGRDTKAARRVCPPNLWNLARRKLDQINFVTRLDSLRVPPGNRLEALKGDRKGLHSIRINQQYRICFSWSENGPGLVEIVGYH